MRLQAAIGVTIKSEAAVEKLDKVPRAAPHARMQASATPCVRRVHAKTHTLSPPHETLGKATRTMARRELRERSVTRNAHAAVRRFVRAAPEDKDAPVFNAALGRLSAALEETEVDEEASEEQSGGDGGRRDRGFGG